MRLWEGWKFRSVTKFRDSVRKIVFGTNFVIIDVESQESIDYAYPLRDLGYVYGEYEKQARKIRRQNRKGNGLGQRERGQREEFWGKSGKTADIGAYLYGFSKENRLKPTVVFLLYSGIKEWDGPLDLYGMLDFTGIPEELKGRVQNHGINLIDIHRMPEEELAGFRTDVGKIFKLIRYSEEKEKLAKLVETDDYYRNMREDAYWVAANYTNMAELNDSERFRTKQGGYDMCTAIKELIEDGRQEGRREGKRDALHTVILRMVELGRDDAEIRLLTGCDQDSIDKIRENQG